MRKRRSTTRRRLRRDFPNSHRRGRLPLAGGLVWTVCVELANPAAKDLKRHAIDLGPIGARRAFTNRRQCKSFEANVLKLRLRRS